MTKEELEKEAEEYRKEKLKEQKDKFVFELPEVYVADIKQAYLAGAESREKRIAELEKENAELKETVTKINNVIIETFSNLTKAKEIIKELVRVEYADFTNGDYSNELSKVLEQAEQFLSEVEK